MRAFVYYRQILLQNQDLYKKITQLDEKINNVFQHLLNKIETKRQKTEPVGYRIKTKNDNS